MLVVECGTGHGAERRYVLDVVLGRFLGIPFRVVERPGAREVTVTAANAPGGARLTIADGLLGPVPDLVSEAALPPAPLEWADVDPSLPVAGGRVPVLYGRRGAGGGFVEGDGETLHLGVDVLGGSFFLLAQLEEAVRPDADEHGRFPTEASFLIRHGLEERPVVDEYVEVLWWALRRLWPRLERRRRQFAISPTCDVDWPYYSRGRVLETLRLAARDVRVRGNRALALARVRSLLAIRRGGRDADPCNSFEFLMRESEQRGIRTSFYLMSLHRDPVYDTGYSLDDDWLRGVLRSIAARGHELGLHASYRTFGDRGSLAADLARLREALAAEGIEAAPLGGRQHFLRWRSPTSWRDWDALGLDYDSSVGFATAVGFRCGTCHEYPAFDVTSGERLGLLERPLVAMEGALLVHGGLAPDAAAERMRRLRDVCRSVDGTFTFLWHNNRLTTQSEREAYVSLLE